MGRLLKLCVHVVLLSVLCLNVYYFSKYYGMSFGKSYYYNFFSLTGKREPLTIRGNAGRLGNQMFLLATLYGLGKLNNREIALMPKNWQALTPYFELDFPQVDTKSFRAREAWKIGHWLTPKDSSIPVTSNIVSGNVFPTSFTFFDHDREDISKIFRFKLQYKEHAEDFLRHVKRVRPWTQVHVRRGDFLRKSAGGWLRAFNGREVDVEYFRKSTEYFRSKFGNITFLAVSDDRKWTRDNLSPLGILTLPDFGSPGHDLAVLSSCNHTIMTYGTFGFWGGFLAGGEVVYFSDFIKPNSKASKMFLYEKMYPEDWTGISTTPDGYWDKYNNPFMK